MAWISAVRTLAAAALLGVTSCPPTAFAGETNSRSERCFRLRQQLDAAIATKTIVNDGGAVHRLRKKAIHFCATRKEAQGARAFAKALSLYGVTPSEPPLPTENQLAKEN